MKMQKHNICLESEQHFNGRVPTQHLGYLMANMPIAIRGAVSMAFRNRSKSKGVVPRWLQEASDLRFTGHGGNGTTELKFELPSLGVAAEEIYSQRLLFESGRPEGSLTGLDLLINVFGEIDEKKSDSDAFDPQLLRQVSKFQRFFKSGPFTGFRLLGSKASSNKEALVNSQTIEHSVQLHGRTPTPQRVRIVGSLDGIEASTQRFSLILDSGERVAGVFPEDSSDQLQTLWRSRVLVMGKAVFRASGNLLRVEAESIEDGKDAASLFSTPPVPSNGRFDPEKLRRNQGSRSGMAAIMGKWPGDESEEEIARALEQIS